MTTDVPSPASRTSRECGAAAPSGAAAAWSGSATECQSGSPNSSFEEALRLWLNWNDAYEKLTSHMFEVGEDQEQLEALMDHVDRIRQQAVDLSRKMLS